LGKIIEDKIKLSTLGKMASQMWLEIPSHHPGITLDEFVVMPNHIHGVIIISPKKQGACEGKSVETLHATSVQTTVNEKMSEISPRKGSLSVVIRSYKSSLIRWAMQNGYERFAWQARYYDHIIRNEEALWKIRTYIKENPMKWTLDRYYLQDK
jgi:putative transposase